MSKIYRKKLRKHSKKLRKHSKKLRKHSKKRTMKRKRKYKSNHKRYTKRYRSRGGGDAPNNINSDVLNILVAAHNRKFEGGLSEGGIPYPAHFQEDLIKTQITSKYSDKDYDIVTMDSTVPECCLPNESRGRSSISGEYYPSVYDGYYTVKNRVMFDMVFIPDIGVPDKEHITNKIFNGTATKKEVEQYIDGCLELVKESGWLYIGKSFEFSSDEYIKTVLDKYTYSIEKLLWKAGSSYTFKFAIINKI